jgi:hypothetical protein
LTDQIPPALYAVVGILVVTNLSTVGALIVFIFKCGVFVATTNAGIKDAKATAVRAHHRIDKIEKNRTPTEGGENEITV